jgi:hypothetical protein
MNAGLPVQEHRHTLRRHRHRRARAVASRSCCCAARAPSPPNRVGDQEPEGKAMNPNKSSMLRIAVPILRCATTLAALAAGPALAQVPGRLDLGSSAQFHQPRFKVEAIGFVAVDETGPDWWGSDEVNSFFYTRQSQPRLAVPREVGNVDKGDEEHYGEQERCILPRRVIRNVGASEVLQAPDDVWDCRASGVAGPIAFTVTMYEGDDYSRFPFCFSGPASPAHEIEGRDCQDDLVGQATVSFTVEQLLDMMPRVDNTFVGNVTLGGPCGPGNDACGGWGPKGPEFHFGYRITRLPDRVLKHPPAAPET